MLPNCNFDRIPAKMKALDHWVNWRRTLCHGKPKKPLYIPKTPRKAKSDDPVTWRSYEIALEAYQLGHWNYAGIGFAIEGTGLVAVDLDECRDPVTRQVAKWAGMIVEKLQSYTELSPSGEGIRIICRGKLPSNRKHTVHLCAGFLELWDSGRYVTMTGCPAEPWSGWNDIRDVDYEEFYLWLEKNMKIYRPAEEPHQAKDCLEKWQHPVLGDWKINKGGCSTIEIVCLGTHLDSNGKECPKNDGKAFVRETPDGPFSGCLHANCSWSSERGNHWNDLKAHYERSSARRVRVSQPKRKFDRRSFDDIRSQHIDWLWKGRLAIGHITNFFGDPGMLKSLASIDIAARITQGKEFPDGEENPYEPSSVIVLTHEDGLADTVKPRFLAAGGDPQKLYTLTLPGTNEPAVLKIEDDLEEMEAIMPNDTALIIFDALIDFVRVKKIEEDKVRDTLTYLKRFLERLHTAVIGIGHLNKKSDLEAIHRAMNAKAFVSVARLNYLFGRKSGGQHHMVGLKNNLWTKNSGLKYHYQNAIVTDGSLRLETGRIMWDGPTDMDPDDLLSRKPARNESVEWLKAFLSDGEKVPYGKIVEAGKQAGFSEDQLKRAKVPAGVSFAYTHTVPATTVWFIKQPRVQ
jgi:hypothetical protein